MLEYNEIVSRKYILMDGEPYEVLDSHVFRKQQRIKADFVVAGSPIEHVATVGGRAEQEHRLEIRNVL